MNIHGLNEAQASAVTTGLGPVLVLAGAGSGKTRVLTYRIAYIIEQSWFNPSQILAVTFTNKAAAEMQDRVSTLLGQKLFKNMYRFGSWGNPAVPLTTTFHSFGVRLLRNEITQLGYRQNFGILDSDDQLKIIKDCLKQLEIETHIQPGVFRSYISSAKNILQTPSNFNLGLDPYIHRLVSEIYVRYQNELQRQNLVDFDDLLLLPVLLFQTYPDILTYYQQKFQYILVDEYQDTNHAQYVLLQLLAQKYKNIFVVGDDAQSIYGFRGSNIANILNFERDYPESVVIALEQNYRSTKAILDVAAEIIQLNENQKPKKLWTQQVGGEKVVLEEAEDGRHEACIVANHIIAAVSIQSDSKKSLETISTHQQLTNDNVYARQVSVKVEELSYESSDDAFAEDAFITEESTEPVKSEKPFSILDYVLQQRRTVPGQLPGVRKNTYSRLFQVQRLPQEHSPLQQFAVLYRTHAQSRQLEEVFLEAGISYRIIGGVRFYERKEIKDILAYLRALENPNDAMSLARALSAPARGIGPKGMEKILQVYSNQLVLTKQNLESEVTAENQNAMSVEQPEQWSRTAEVLAQTTALQSKQRTGGIHFFHTMHTLQFEPAETSLAQLTKKLIETIDYETWLRKSDPKAEERIENIRELVTVIAKYDDLAWPEALTEFLAEVSLIAEADNRSATDDAVTLMTLHAAKGLEFDTVFFVGLEEGLLPHSQSVLDPEQLAEEVRLAYVGVTRARKKLYLLYARQRSIYGTTQSSRPSRILKALPAHAVSGIIPGSEYESDEFTYDANEM